MSALTDQITNSTIAKWFRALSKREKGFVSLGVAALVAVLMFGFVLPTTLDFRDANVTRYQSSFADISYMRAFEESARAKGQSEQSGSGSGDIELASISRSASLHDISLQRIQPVTDGVTIEITREEFDGVIGWLFSLQNDEGMNVSQARILRLGAGLVDARIVVQ